MRPWQTIKNPFLRLRKNGLVFVRNQLAQKQIDLSDLFFG
jgi:hypothetical protein